MTRTATPTAGPASGPGARTHGGRGARPLALRAALLLGASGFRAAPRLMTATTVLLVTARSPGPGDRSAIA